MLDINIGADTILSLKTFGAEICVIVALLAIVDKLFIKLFYEKQIESFANTALQLRFVNVYNHP